MNTDSEKNTQNYSTGPLAEVSFSDIFNLAEIQQLQDLFSDATGVASQISHPDGTPITRPSNFRRLCGDIIRKTEKGRANCCKSDSIIGSQGISAPAIQPCQSCGLWDAGASISVGGQHIANWLIGQVRNEKPDEKQIVQYADEIGVDRDEFMSAFSEVPLMTIDQFTKVAKMMFAFANELSEKAYNNLLLKSQITEREKAVQMLQESEEHLFTTLHSIGDAVLSTDKNGMIVSINARASSLCGWSMDDAAGRALHEVFNIVNSDTREIVADPVKKVLESGQVIGLANHTVLISKKGTEYQIANSAAPIKDREGKIKGVVLVFSDVTEKYKTQKALLESERSKSVLLSNIPGMAYRCRFDNDWTMEFVSEGFYNLTGYKAEDILQNRTITFNEMIFPEYREHLWVVWERAAKFHEAIHEEYRIRTADNQVKWVWEQGIPIYNEAGEVEALEGLILDITGRKQMEETLHNEHLLLRTIIDNIPDAIYTKDLDCRKTLANIAEVRFMGAQAEADVLGKEDFDFYPRELAEKYQADDKLVMQTGVPVINREDYIVDRNNQKRWLLSSKLPLHDKDNRIIGLVGIGHDITEHRNSENAMRESESLYRNLVEKLPDGVYKSTHDGKFVEVNPAMAKMLGYASKEELMDIDIKTQLYFEDTIRGNTDFYDNQTKTGIYRMKKKDGSEIWVEDHGWYNFDESVNILYHEGIMLDVTESRQAALALQESEALYRNLVERLPDGVYKSTHDGKFVDVNPAMVKMLGYESKEELLKIDIKSQLYFKSSDRESLVLQEKLEEMGVYPLKKKDGTAIWVEDHGWYNVDEKGNILFHEGVMRDITERKRADEAIRKSEEQHRTILQTAQDGFWLVDKAGCLLEVNDAYCKMSDYSSEELLAMHISDVESVETAENTYFRMMQIMKHGESRFESKHRRKDGSIFDIEVSVKYQPVEDGRYVAFIHNITDRKIKEQELTKAKEKAEESDRLKSAFLANMSHEIRTPMNGILGFAELLKSPGLSGDEQQEYIRIIKKSGDRMLNIINDIVDISKIESGQATLYESETKVNEQTQFLYSFFKPEVDKKGIGFVLRNGLPDNQAVVKTDKEKLYAILTNLIKNAIKFTREGSIEIGYKLIRNEQPLYRTDWQQSAPSALPMALEFYVKDTGYGIPVDRQQAIFDRFVQADIADSRAFQGAGLGLSISKAYVEMMGGRIRVESEEGKGSAFYFTIPYYTDSVQNLFNPQLMVNEENLQRKKLKILIVEDDETSEMLISIAVRMLSKEILKVRSGIQAIDTCRNNPDIDLILMDIKMPEMDGYEATRQIRIFNKDVFIIAQTAYGLESEREKALESGCSEYISKPLDIALLKDIIQKHFKTAENGF